MMGAAAEIFQRFQELPEGERDELWLKIGAGATEADGEVPPSILAQAGELRNLFFALIRDRAALEKWRRRRYSPEARELVRAAAAEGDRLKAEDAPTEEMFAELDQSLEDIARDRSDG